MFNIPALSETYWLDFYNEHLLDVGVIYYSNKMDLLPAIINLADVQLSEMTQ